MRKTLVTMLLVALFLTGVSGFAFAAGPWKANTLQGDTPQWAMRFGRGIDGFPGAGPFFPVTLTIEQKEKMLEIQKKNLETLQNLRNQIQSAHLALQELSLKPASTETAEQIREKMKEIMNLRQQIRTVKENMYQEFLNLLTPEQLTQLAQRQGPMRKMGMMAPWGRWKMVK